MLCVSIKGPSFQEVEGQIQQASLYADLIELRLDYFQDKEIYLFADLPSKYPIPIILTLKNSPFPFDLVSKLHPQYLDIEYEKFSDVVDQFLKDHPEIKLILSYHDYTKTPEHLHTIFQQMKKIPAFFYKIAVTANNCLEGHYFFKWNKQIYNSEISTLTVSMGSHGQITRILSPLLGNPITYASLDDQHTTAPGQLSAKILVEQYRHSSLNALTQIYGLIGDPVEHSISDITHNHFLKMHNLNAVYVKTQVKPHELKEFLEIAKNMYQGLSVTMPLKETILPYLDQIDSDALAIEAINTLLFQDQKILGFNTDGIGALNAIEKKISVKGKKIWILGAGGAAKAIAYEAKKRGAYITILNRTIEKGKNLAKRLECDFKPFDQVTECCYDILINCTPSSQPIEKEYILPHSYVMDIKTKPQMTPFLLTAFERKCTIIYGYEMFVEQALGQYNIWFKDQLKLSETRQSLEESALFCLQKTTLNF